MDWRRVCRGVGDSCWTVCGGIGGSCWIAGIGGSCGGVFCAITCFGAPLVGARGFLGFRPLLFGMEREPTAPAGSTLFTFQDIAEYAGPLAGSRPCHHGTGLTADSMRLKQILLNLLNNASKFTKEGEVALLLRAARMILCENGS